MSFFHAIRQDLQNPRILPFLVALGIALVGAVAYLALGGSSSSTTTPSAVSHISGSVPNNGPAVSQAPVNPHQAVAETTTGGKYQHEGKTHDPFQSMTKPAASKKNKAGSTTTTGKGNKTSATNKGSATTTGGSEPSSSTKSATGESTKGTSKPKAPAKPKPLYVVSLLAGFAPSPGQPANLTAYPDVKVGEKLPSKTDPRLIFKRVSSGAKGAVFKLLVPPILHGPATCLPSSENCEEIYIPIKQAEQLEYVEANGQTVVYEVGVVSITKVSLKASLASSHPVS